MSLPQIPQRSVKIAGLPDQLIVRAMSAACYVELMDARAAEKSEVYVAAVIARHCVPSWRENSVEEIMDSVEPAVLVDVMQAVLNFTEIESGNSVAGRPVSSSSS